MATSTERDDGTRKNPSQATQDSANPLGGIVLRGFEGEVTTSERLEVKRLCAALMCRIKHTPVIEIDFMKICEECAEKSGIHIFEKGKMGGTNIIVMFFCESGRRIQAKIQAGDYTTILMGELIRLVPEGLFLLRKKLKRQLREIDQRLEAHKRSCVVPMPTPSAQKPTHVLGMPIAHFVQLLEDVLKCFPANVSVMTIGQMIEMLECVPAEHNPPAATVEGAVSVMQWIFNHGGRGEIQEELDHFLEHSEFRSVTERPPLYWKPDEEVAAEADAPAAVESHDGSGDSPAHPSLPMGASEMVEQKSAKKPKGKRPGRKRSLEKAMKAYDKKRNPLSPGRAKLARLSEEKVEERARVLRELMTIQSSPAMAKFTQRRKWQEANLRRKGYR